MSTFPTATLDHVGARAAAVGTLSRLFSDMIDGIFARFREERTRRELLKLDDRMLNDIGLSRSDIYSGKIMEMNQI
jgi:uncharacterized protein YjiS (DUF1127 family)